MSLSKFTLQALDVYYVAKVNFFATWKAEEKQS